MRLLDNSFIEFKLRSNFSLATFNCRSSFRLVDIKQNDCVLENAHASVSYAYPTSTSSDHVVSLVSSWIAKCDQCHARCGKKVCRSGYLPPRLLDVIDEGVKLINTVQLPKPTDCRYITLSHCWGSDSFPILTRDNEISFQEQIPLHDLPPNFVHAIDFCKRSGIRYLWIDSLCILQEGEGSEQDWLRHVVEMRHVYQNCYFNISAANNQSAHAGLYCTRDPDTIKPLIVQSPGIEGLPYGLHMFGHSLTQTLGWRMSPLNTRGWVLQERLLSPRVLYFTDTQVFWHCSETQACETYPVSMTWAYPSDGQVTNLRLPDKSISPSLFALTDTTKSYIALVEEYTRRQLKFPDKDKLPAFAAIAEHMACVFDDRYIAGFFQLHLPEALAWTGQISTSKPSCPDYRGPSWSWIKKDAPVQLMHLSYAIDTRGLGTSKDFASLIHANVELVNNNDPFGRIRSAELLMRGTLLPFHWSIGLPGNSEWAYDNEDDRPKSPFGSRLFVSQLQFDDLDGIRIEQESAFILPLYSRPWKKLSMFCLLLHGSRRDDRIVYERIGVLICEVMPHVNIDDTVHTILQLPKQEIILV